MIARCPPFTLRNVLDRVGLASPQKRSGFIRRLSISRWQRIVAALADWYAQICRCRYCGEQTIRVWLLGWW